MSGLDEVVEVFVTLTTGETALTTFSAVLFGVGAFAVEVFFAGDFFGAAFFAVVFLGAAFFAGADFLGVYFFFCVAMTHIIATRTTP